MELYCEEWRVRPRDGKRLRKVFQEWTFNRFADTVRSEFKEEKLPAPSAAVQQRDLFAGLDNGVARADEWKHSSFQDHKYHLVDTPESFDKFLQELAGQRRIAFDLETTSLSPRQAEIVGYAFS